MTHPGAQAESGHHPCPWCDNPVPTGAGDCPSCGQPLCPECGARVGAYWPNCMTCGAKRELVCPKCEAPVKPRDRTCSHCGTSLERGAAAEPPPPAPAPQASPSLPPVGQSVPACSICGRQDETLRLAAFPYVFSVVFLTFRRAFGGLWCRKHRNLYWALSSLITSLLGWFGIPFGFVYTPLAMFKLARGGEQPLAQNQHLLQVLAGHKLRVGDAPGAIRCLEEALRLHDDAAGRQRLQDLYEQHLPSTQQEARLRAWPLLAAVLGAAATGIAIGLLDSAITAGFSTLFGESGNLFLVVLSWTPWIALLFLGGLVLGQWVEWGLRRSGCRHMGLGSTFAVILALVTLYGTQQGAVIAEYVGLLGSGELFAGPLENVAVAWFTVTVGGAFYFVDMVRSGGLVGAIYLVVLVVAAVYYVETGLRVARSSIRWQQALAAVRARGEAPRVRALGRGWLAVVAVFVCVACSVASLPLQGLMGSLGQTMTRLDQAGELHQQNQVDQAIEELEALVADNPDLAFAHNALGMSYARRGQFDRAAEELEIAVELQPEWGTGHAALANVYYLVDNTDLLEQELRLAKEFGADDGFTQSLLGDIYGARGEFARAEEQYLRAIDLLPEEAWVHLRLAGACAAQGKYEQALAMCDRALELEADLVDAHVVRGYVHIRQEDLDGAWAAFSQALALAPEDPSVHSALSYLHFLRGEAAESLQEAEEALRLDPYDPVGCEQKAFAHHAQGDLDQALSAAQEAVRLNPKDDTSYYVLGLCYRDSGETEEASQAFKTFLAQYKDRAYVRDWKAEAEAYLAAQE